MTEADLPPPGLFKNVRDRLATFENMSLDNEYVLDLVQTGIYRDALCNYRCAYCSLYMKKLDARQLKYHKFSTCEMATFRLLNNETLRKQSFTKFKTARVYFRDKLKELANNGFYYYGVKFEIRCSSCLLTIVKLNKQDDICQIHHKYSPTCKFNAPSAPAWEPDDNYSSNHLYPKLPLCDDATVNYSDEPKQTITSAHDDVTCKICFEREREVCFLPCRHVSTCWECANKCKVCCICREKIKNKLEVYLQ